MPRARSKSGTEEAHLARPSVAPKNIRGELGVTSDANQLLPAAESCYGNQWVEASGGADIGSVANRRFGLRKWSAVAAKLPCCRDR